MKLVQTILFEAVKEFIRVFLAGYSIILGTILTGINPQTGIVHVNWAVVQAMTLFLLVTSLIKAIDRLLFVWKKETGGQGEWKGLMGF